MKIKKYGNTELKIREIAQPIADELGYDIWDIQYVKEGAEWYLRVFIDKEDGIDIDDCEAMTRPLNEKLDELDPIKDSYIFEVGSAGLERELVREEHFKACTGLEVRAHLFMNVNGSRDIIGTLASYTKESVKLVIDGEEKEIPLSDIAYIRLYEEFEFD
ncbi:MAG: ribosome maturation factor RimP [Oscillospiraceae bacterium]|nr:ribosome maturation factor RimP [Oscillospiraceae bacterium]